MRLGMHNVHSSEFKNFESKRVLLSHSFQASTGQNRFWCLTLTDTVYQAVAIWNSVKTVEILHSDMVAILAIAVMLVEMLAEWC